MVVSVSPCSMYFLAVSMDWSEGVWVEYAFGAKILHENRKVETISGNTGSAPDDHPIARGIMRS